MVLQVTFCARSRHFVCLVSVQPSQISNKNQKDFSAHLFNLRTQLHFCAESRFVFCNCIVGYSFGRCLSVVAELFMQFNSNIKIAKKEEITLGQDTLSAILLFFFFR
jgi:hypothetical protein